MDRQTLRDWVHRFNAQGLAGLSNDHSQGGRPPRLTEEQKAELAAIVRKGPDRAVHGVVRAVCPARETGAALILPTVNTQAMSLHLAEISRQVAPGAHAILILDGAGWHKTGGALAVPENITLLPLPPYAPELNPVENIWQYLRQNDLCHTVWESYDAIVEACCDA